MIYPIEFTITNVLNEELIIKQNTTYIPKNERISLVIKNNIGNIKNLKIFINDKEFYLFKNSNGDYEFILDNSIIPENELEIYFIAEVDYLRDKYLADIYSDKITLNLTDNNYNNTKYSTLEKINNKINELILEVI